MKKINFILILTLFTFSLMAQGTIRGTLFDKETGEPIIYGNVYLENTTIGTNTDIDGIFTLPKVDAGEYILSATYLGYDTISVNISLKDGQVLNKQLYISEGGLNLDVVNITAEKDIARNEVKVSKLTVSPQQIAYMPAAAGEPDIAQYLQVIPGIISTGDSGGQIFIRGGSPVQNKIMLDGLTIINPFHSIGFFSTFETDAIRNVDVLTGAYNAEYSGRISAIVNINTKEGNKKRMAGSISASPFLAKAFIEGPIIKFNEKRGSSTSFMFSQKYSYIDRTGRSIYPYVAKDSKNPFPYKINDTYGKLSMVAKNGTKVNLFGFNYVDQFNNEEVANISWNNYGGGANFNLILENSNTAVSGLIGYTNYKIGFNEVDALPRESALSNFVGRVDFDNYLKNSLLKVGFQVNANSTDFTFWNPFKVLLEARQNTINGSGYVKYRHKFFDRLIIEPGVRAIYYNALKTSSIEPRIGLKFNVNDNIRIKAAAGLYSQDLISTSNERDVVNLFTGFLTAPEERVFQLNTRVRSKDNLQKSTQSVIGVEFDVLKNLTFNVEGYYKLFNQLIVVNRTKLEATDANYVTEEGEAYGFDVSAKYQTSKIYLWATYSNSYVNRNDGDQVYPTLFDRRHNVNVVANYKFGERNSWNVGLRWNYGSGFPFTQTQAFYTYFPFENGASTDVVSENPKDVGILYSEKRNGGRLPSYHRLDLSIAKKIIFDDYRNLEITASVTNAYNRANIFFFDRVTYNRVDQLPILPSVNVKFNF